MTRKDYELIAHTIRDAEISWEATEEVARDLADALKADNPRFDAERFIAACGIYSEAAQDSRRYSDDAS